MKVLVIGCDLTSHGGIASVVKVFYEESKNTQLDYKLLKTTDYKHANKLSNSFLLIKAFFHFLLLLPKTDVVHLQGSSHASFYRKAIFLVVARLFFKPVIWNFHASRFEEFFIAKSGISKRVIGFLLKLASRVIVLSEDLKASLQTKYTLSNIAVLRNPVEQINFNLKNKKLVNGPVNYLFLGFYIKNKGVLDLLEVIKLFDNDHKYHFNFAGTGDLEKVINNSARKEKSNVTNLGWLDGDNKYNAIASSDVLILPSYREGMPIVILEAMSLGIPVISTSIAAIPELITNNEEGLLFNPGDLDTLKECIIKMQDPQFRADCSKKAISKVTHYYPSSVLSDLIKIYKEVNK